jgi:hypothetical protein
MKVDGGTSLHPVAYDSERSLLLYHCTMRVRWPSTYEQHERIYIRGGSVTSIICYYHFPVNKQFEMTTAPIPRSKIRKQEGGEKSEVDEEDHDVANI